MHGLRDGDALMFGYPFIDPPPAKPALPKFLPPLPTGFTAVAISCVPCGERCDPEVDDIAVFLQRHRKHINAFLEQHQTSRPIWRRKR